MITTAELLQAAKSRAGIPSNYRLARVMGIPETTIQRWNTGKGRPDDTMTARLADLAGIDPGFAVACIRAEREGSGPLGALWRDVARRLAPVTAAAAVLLVTALAALPGPVQAAGPAAALARVCILCKVATGIFRRRVCEYVQAAAGVQCQGFAPMVHPC